MVGAVLLGELGADAEEGARLEKDLGTIKKGMVGGTKNIGHSFRGRFQILDRMGKKQSFSLSVYHFPRLGVEVRLGACGQASSLLIRSGQGRHLVPAIGSLLVTFFPHPQILDS